jgi:dihydrofolate reductase
VCYAQNRVIGRDGDLPWRYAEDLKHFKRTTMGHAILMGRKTYESIGRPLPGRRNVIITRQAEFVAAGCEVVGSLEEALDAARASDPCPFVIGGASIYELALPLATELHLTEVQLEVEGDVYFPAIDESRWTEVERRTGDARELLFRTLVRLES